jgi:hypothetical protein
MQRKEAKKLAAKIALDIFLNYDQAEKRRIDEMVYVSWEKSIDMLPHFSKDKDKDNA